MLVVSNRLIVAGSIPISSGLVLGLLSDAPTKGHEMTAEMEDALNICSGNARYGAV